MTEYSGTYTFASGNGATVDLGTTHTYRYVNATNVYNKGKSDGKQTGNLKYYGYIIGNTAAAKLTNCVVNDYIFLVGYGWNSGNRPDYLVNATKTGLSSEIRFANFVTAATPAEGGSTADTLSNPYNTSPFLIYKATSTTITVSKVSSRYLIVRLTFV